jgi:hypothetical protein
MVQGIICRHSKTVTPARIEVYCVGLHKARFAGLNPFRRRTAGMGKLSGFVRAEDGRYDRFEEFMSETAFPLRKVEQALEDAGFGSVRYADGADLGATLDDDPEAKLRVFLVAGK